MSVQSSTLKEWLRRSFEKNRNFLERQAAGQRKINWEDPNVLVGGLSLGLFQSYVTASAAEEQKLAETILDQMSRFISEAIERRGADRDRDEIDLERIEIWLANRLGSIVDGSLFVPWPLPFEAFATCLSDRSQVWEILNAANFLWALLAVVEGATEEYDAAVQVRQRPHPDLRTEMELMPQLRSIAEDPETKGWKKLESCVTRWLSPTLKTKSYATNFQDAICAGLVLFWCKYRLGTLTRDALLKTYFGETLQQVVTVS